LEERVASIFRLEEITSSRKSVRQQQLLCTDDFNNCNRSSKQMQYEEEIEGVDGGGVRRKRKSNDFR
jgi:hypothetical protein